MDNNTYSIDEQFLIGPAFLVSPILRENETSVDAYFAADLWYDYHNGTIAYNNYEKGEWITLYANYSEIPLHIRSGYIIPTQNPANTTKYARKNPFGLIVALNNDNEAIGDLFYDDGESQNVAVKNYFLSTFIARDNKLEMHIEYDKYKGSDQMILDTIRLLHNKKYDSSWVFILNKKTVIDSDNITFSETEIVLSNLGIQMSDDFRIDWVTLLSFDINF
jgi:maltase-glucoamylase